MRKIYIRSFVGLAAVMAAGAALAQSYNSFYQVTAINGIDLQQNGLSYTLTLNPGAYVIYNNQQLDVSDIFGFFALKGGSTALNASGASQNGWDWNYTSNGSGTIAGWQNPDKQFDIQPGGQKTFTYTALDQSSLEDFGWHLTFVQDWPETPGAKTAFVQGPLNPVPEPATLAGLGIGALAFLRRRRRQV